MKRIREKFNLFFNWDSDEDFYPIESVGEIVEVVKDEYNDRIALNCLSKDYF